MPQRDSYISSKATADAASGAGGEANRSDRPSDQRNPSAPTHRDETPLLPKVAAGVPGAVEEVLDRYSGAIWNMARRLCRNRVDAEDATQDVFVEIWRHAARFDANAGSEWTFVLTVARRRLIDRLRRFSRRKDIAYGEAGGPSEPVASIELDPATAPPEAAQTQEDAKIALDALSNLSRDQQTVLRLSLFEGMSYPEISERLDIPLGTIKTHARRGLIKLRQLLGAEEQEDEAG